MGMSEILGSEALSVILGNFAAAAEVGPLRPTGPMSIDRLRGVALKAWGSKNARLAFFNKLTLCRHFSRPWRALRA
jgi:hypothetical protein